MLKKSFHLAAAFAVTVSPVLLVGTAGAEEGAARTTQFWWPEQLNLSPLRQHAAESDPYGTGFDYAKAFAAVDLAALKADIKQVLTTSQPWWPADYGNYGPFFIRMACRTRSAVSGWPPSETGCR